MSGSWQLSDIPPHIRELNQETLNNPIEKPQSFSVKKDTDWEAELLQQITLLGLPEPEREYKFHPDRKWRFDLAWPDESLKVCCEVEGGIWTGGRHSRGAGFEKDTEKYANGLILGWKILRVTPGQIERGEAIGWLEKLLTD